MVIHHKSRKLQNLKYLEGKEKKSLVPKLHSWFLLFKQQRFFPSDIYILVNPLFIFKLLLFFHHDNEKVT